MSGRKDNQDTGSGCNRRGFLKTATLGTGLVVGVPAAVQASKSLARSSVDEIRELEVQFPAEPVDNRAIVHPYHNPSQSVRGADGISKTVTHSNPDVAWTYVDDDPISLEAHVGGTVAAHPVAAHPVAVVSAYIDFELASTEPRQISLTADYEYGYRSKIGSAPLPAPPKSEDSTPTHSPEAAATSPNQAVSTSLPAASVLISVASLGGDLLSYSTATMFGSATIMSTDGDGTFTPESPDESNLLFYGRNSTAGISPIRIASESDSETDAELFGSVTGFEADPEKVYRLVFTIVTEIDAVGLTAGSAEIGETSKWGPQGLLVDQVNISVEETPN